MLSAFLFLFLFQKTSCQIEFKKCSNYNRTFLLPLAGGSLVTKAQQDWEINSYAQTVGYHRVMDQISTWSCWQLHHSKQKGSGRPLHLVTAGAVGHSFSFNCQLCCLLSSGRCAADTSSVSGWHFLFKAPIISMLNIITHPVNMRTDWIKNTLLSLGLKNTSVMCCPPSYWLWVGCGTFIQCDRGEPGTLFPGTPVPPHTDTLLWSATLILIKCCLTRAHEDQGCSGGRGGCRHPYKYQA